MRNETMCVISGILSFISLGLLIPGKDNFCFVIVAMILAAIGAGFSLLALKR